MNFDRQPTRALTPSQGTRALINALLFVVGVATTMSASADAAMSTGPASSLVLSVDHSKPLAIPMTADVLDRVAGDGVIILLNNYDVTPFSRRSRKTLEIALNSPLAEGDYRLEIVRFTADGLSELLFQRRLTLRPIQKSASADLRASVFYRAQQSDKDDFAATVRTLSDAALRLQASRSDHAGSLSFSADVQYRSDESKLISGDTVAMPNFLAESQTTLGEKTLTLAAGHQRFGGQAVPANSLVLDQFRRRGLSLAIADASGDNQLTVFASSSEPLVSINQDILVSRNRRERTVGAALRFSPIPMAPQKLQLTASYLDGQSVLEGTSINYDTGLFEATDLTYGGETGSVGLSSTWWNGGLRFEAEEAFSDFDADGLDVGNAKRKDTARSLRVTAASEGDWAPDPDSTSQRRRWRFELSRQIVGPDFYSIANVGLPGDLDTTAALIDASGDRWRFESAWVSAVNDVDDRLEQPRQKVTERTASLYLHPAHAGEAGHNSSPLRRMLGQPSLGLRVKLADRHQPLEDALLTGQEIDDETRELGVSLDLVKPTSQWRFEYSAVDYDNRAALEVLGNTLLFTPASDNRNRFATVQFSYRPSERIMLSPVLQWSRFHERETTGQQRAINYGVQSSFHWLDGRLKTDINYASNTQRSTSAFDSLASQRYGSAQLDVIATYKAWLPTGSRPGVDLSLRTNWNVNRSNLQRNDARYQVLLGIQIHWQARR